MKTLSQTPKAITQRTYRARKRESLIVLPIPLHGDVVRVWLMQAGAPADLAEHDRQAAGELLGHWLESLGDD